MTPDIPDDRPREKMAHEISGYIHVFGAVASIPAVLASVGSAVSAFTSGRPLTGLACLIFNFAATKVGQEALKVAVENFRRADAIPVRASFLPPRNAR